MTTIDAIMEITGCSEVVAKKVMEEKNNGSELNIRDLADKFTLIDYECYNCCCVTQNIQKGLKDQKCFSCGATFQT